MERARREFASALIFGGDVDRGIEGLALDGGPPEKILERLRTPAEMTEQRRSANGLGRNMLDWLKSEGFKASGESQTTLNNAAEMRRRTWNDGISDRRFEFHLKPVEGTSPDRCVRIYFEYDEARAKTVIGWVGRHP